jgi:elongation factor G
VFKVQMDGSRKILFLRIYAGTLREGDSLMNAATGLSERVMRLYRLRAGQREQLEQAGAGDIVAVQGPKEAGTGDTLISPGAPRVLLEALHLRRPVLSLAFEPKNNEEGTRLDAALRNFCLEDPTLHVEMNEGAQQRVVSGMGELQLEVLTDRLRREYGLSTRTGNPQVLCRETIVSAAEETGEFDRELGGQPHYGLVKLRVAPRARGSGILVDCDFGRDFSGEWPGALLEAARQGAHDACNSGPRGHALDDVEVLLVDLGRKQGLATAPGLHMAAQQAVRAAVEKGKSRLLEPLMQVDITTPEDFLGPVIALLGARGARIEGIEAQDTAGGAGRSGPGRTDGPKAVRALAPMRALFGFATALRSASQGRAGLMMSFLRFDTV